ncbi:MAG TPA: DUF5985 family protein [Allosphingosinicella sp.]|uniref:DUF5985 family protein n=1 Tax=Allosphingosinicella sp. TaxID=2823234 RepID=UPI002EDA3991
MTDGFPALVYLLCFATSAACAWLLWRSYGRTGARLLLWSGLCFMLLALNNLLVIFDLLLIREVSLQIPRLALSVGAVSVLLFGFIWDLEE